MSAKPHKAIPVPGSAHWWTVADKDGDEIGSGDGGFEKEQAVLMAASTDLLEALERLSAQCGRMRMPGQPMSDAEKAALVAIAKAKVQS